MVREVKKNELASQLYFWLEVMRVFYDFSSNNARIKHAHCVGLSMYFILEWVAVTEVPSFTTDQLNLVNVYKVYIYFVENHCHRTHKMKWCGSDSFWKWPKNFYFSPFTKWLCLSPFGVEHRPNQLNFEWNETLFLLGRK